MDHSSLSFGFCFFGFERQMGSQRNKSRFEGFEEMRAKIRFNDVAHCFQSSGTHACNKHVSDRVRARSSLITVHNFMMMSKMGFIFIAVGNRETGYAFIFEFTLHSLSVPRNVLKCSNIIATTNWSLQKIMLKTRQLVFLWAWNPSFRRINYTRWYLTFSWPLKSKFKKKVFSACFLFASTRSLIFDWSILGMGAYQIPILGRRSRAQFWRHSFSKQSRSLATPSRTEIN